MATKIKTTSWSEIRARRPSAASEAAADEARITAFRELVYQLRRDAGIDDLDLQADLNAQDDDGFGWSTLADATAPETARSGAMLLAGNSEAQAVVRVGAVDDDGQIHVAILPGSVAKNRLSARVPTRPFSRMTRSATPSVGFSTWVCRGSGCLLRAAGWATPLSGSRSPWGRRA